MNVSLTNLSDLSPQQYVAVFCGSPACRRHTAGVFLDIQATIERYGDLPLLDLGVCFRCQLCGHKPAEIRIGWDMPPSQARGWV